MTDAEFRAMLDEYASLSRYYRELASSSMTLDREHEACRLPEEVQSLEELRKPLCHRASLETALNTVRREMRQVANRRTQLECDIKAALPADVTYRYNGYRVTKRSSDNALDFRVEESYD